MQNDFTRNIQKHMAPQMKTDQALGQNIRVYLIFRPLVSVYQNFVWTIPHIPLPTGAFNQGRCPWCNSNKKEFPFLLRSFNNYMDQTLPNLDLLPPRVDKRGHFIYPPLCPRGQNVDKPLSPPPPPSPIIEYQHVLATGQGQVTQHRPHRLLFAGG